MALCRRGLGIVPHVLSASTAQLVAEAALERTVVEQRAQLEAQRIELANTKATLTVLKEQEAQLLMQRRHVSQPPTQV